MHGMRCAHFTTKAQRRAAACSRASRGGIGAQSNVAIAALSALQYYSASLRLSGEQVLSDNQNKAYAIKKPNSDDDMHLVFDLF
ncbi:MAG: hypothetical protein RLZZ262_1919 [Bacteroidota bacterium]|jgi:hypothetical protein